MNNLNHPMLSNSSPEHQHQCSSDTGSQHSHSKYMKSEPINDHNSQFQVHLPHFIAAFPPNPTTNSQQFAPQSSPNLVPLTTAFPTYPHTLRQPQITQRQSLSDRDNKCNIIKEDID